jgi:hypothetical protein
VRNIIKGFKEFKRLNEETDIKNIPLRGYPAELIKKRLYELVDVMPDRMKIGVPSDNKGYSITYRDLNGAIQKIEDLEHIYSQKGENITFYCWNIGYGGTPEGTENLKEKIETKGGFGKDKENLRLDKIISYFTKNREDADNVRSISISIDSESIRKEKLARENQGPSQEEIYPSEEPKEGEQSVVAQSKESAESEEAEGKE